MFRKIVYEPVFIPKGRRKEGDIMIRCTQGGRSVDIPTNISIKVSFLKWRLHFGWYEGNPDKAPF